MKPHFLIIGAQKSGTTTLADALGKHSKVYISEPREPEYFGSVAQGNSASWDTYQELFVSASPEMLCGEASTGTMFHSETIPLLDEKLPEVKLLAVLRKPEARAHSGLAHSIKKGRVKVEEGVKLFKEDAESFLNGQDCKFDWFYRSEYGRQLDPFVAHFGGRLKVIIFEELISRPEEILNDVQAFLGLDNEPLDLTKENQSRIPRGRISETMVQLGRFVVGPVRSLLGEKGYRRFRENIMKLMGKKAEPMDPSLSKRLREEAFAKDIQKLERLIGRNIDCW